MNKLQFQGRIGSDIECKTINETTLVKFSLATSEKEKKGDNWVEVTQWHNVEFWGKRAESINRFFKKGDGIIIDGSLKYDKYESKHGHKVTTAKIVGKEWWFPLGKKSSDNQAPPSTPNNQPAPSDDLPF